MRFRVFAAIFLFFAVQLSAENWREQNLKDKVQTAKRYLDPPVVAKYATHKDWMPSFCTVQGDPLLDAARHSIWQWQLAASLERDLDLLPSEDRQKFLAAIHLTAEEIRRKEEAAALQAGKSLVAVVKGDRLSGYPDRGECAPFGDFFDGRPIRVSLIDAALEYFEAAGVDPHKETGVDLRKLRDQFSEEAR